MPGDAEYRQVRLERQDLLGADALLRRLTDQGDVLDLGELRHIGGIGVGVELAQVVLPAHDALERPVAVKQGKGRNQPPLPQHHPLYGVRHLDHPAQGIGDVPGPGRRYRHAQKDDKGAQAHTGLTQKQLGHGKSPAQ